MMNRRRRQGVRNVVHLCGMTGHVAAVAVTLRSVACDRRGDAGIATEKYKYLIIKDI